MKTSMTQLQASIARLLKKRFGLGSCLVLRNRRKKCTYHLRPQRPPERKKKNDSTKTQRSLGFKGRGWGSKTAGQLRDGGVAPHRKQGSPKMWTCQKLIDQGDRWCQPLGAIATIYAIVELNFSPRLVEVLGSPHHIVEA